MNKSDITGIILSGGKSSRLGEEKGLASFNGKPLVSYAIEVLKPICGKLIISANNQLDEYEKFGYELVKDEFEGIGPMGGILTCLKKSESRFNLVLSCDTPFVSTALFNYLLKEAEYYQIVVPSHDGFIEPLCAVYATNVLCELQHSVESGNFKMHDFFKKADLKAIDISPDLPFYSEDLFVNINTPKELKGLDRMVENKVSIKEITTNDLWIKAAVVGGLWASIEIIVGSFLHNARIPMAGSMLAFVGTILLIGFYQMWPQRGLIIRAGLITALMKSVSPSAFILGPMTGIMLEAVLLELMIFIFGNNLLGMMIAGIASVSSALMHKLINLLIFYGFDLIQIYVNIVNFALKQFGLEEAEPVQILIVMLVFYAVFGILAGILGYYIGHKSITLKSQQSDFKITGQPEKKSDFFVIQKNNKTYIPLLIIHIIAIPVGLYLLSYFDDYKGFLFIGAYILAFGFYYRKAMRRLRKPVFWMQLVIIVLLAAFFWDTEKGEGTWISMDGIFIGLEMIVRALFIVTVFTGISVELHNQHVRNFLVNIGLGQFYQAVGMAFGALPIMISLLPTSKEILKSPAKSLLKPLIMADQWVVLFKEG